MELCELFCGGGAGRNERDSTGRTPLHLAAEGGHFSVVYVLLVAGEAVNLVSSSEPRASALTLACQSGHADIVTTLIRHGADMDACLAPHFVTALHEAATGNHPLCITALVEAGADIEASKAYPMQKRTPLHYAAESGSTEAVYALLRHGATTDVRDGSISRHTPLHLAIIGQHPQMVEELLSAGADFSLADDSGVGCVSMPAGVGDVHILKTLIGHGADVNAVCCSARNALHMAAMNNRMEAIDVLVEVGADPGGLDSEGKTPLHYAARYSSSDALVALMRHDCDKDKAGRQGENPFLHVAARERSSAAMVALMAAGADVEARNGPQSHAALDGAVCAGHVREAEVLVQLGADLNASNPRGLTALHQAASWNRAELVDVLLGMGAVVDAKDSAGTAPLMMAAEYDGDSCAAMLALLKHGADVNAQDITENSSLHFAVISTSLLADVTRKVKILFEWDADDMAVGADGMTAGDLASEMTFATPPVFPIGSDDFYAYSAVLFDRLDGLFANAPTERRNRIWGRRRLLVLWRAHPGRFDAIDEFRQAPAGSTEPRDLRDVIAEGRVEAGGEREGDGWSGGGVGMLAAKVAGIEKEEIFRSLVMFL